MAENYRVTGQRQTTDLSGAGRFVEVMEVSFVDNHDNHGSIKVPINQYNADTVRELIEQRVAAMSDVHQL